MVDVDFAYDLASGDYEGSGVFSPISGRESEMSLSSGGAAYAFSSPLLVAFKRWLVLGGGQATYYASADSVDAAGLETVRAALADDYEQAIALIRDVSVGNLAARQSTVLQALAIAMSYSDNVVRVYGCDGDAPYRAFKVNGSVVVSRVSLSNDGRYLKVFCDGIDGRGSAIEYYDVASGHIKSSFDVASAGVRFSSAGETVSAGAIRAVVYSSAVRRAAFDIFDSVVRTASHLFELVKYVDNLRGWGRAFRTKVASYYTNQSPRDLAYQLVKYGVRNGYSHRDVIRLSHPKSSDAITNKLLAWSVDKYSALDNVDPDNSLDANGFVLDPLSLLWAFERIRAANSEDVVVNLIRDYGLVREVVERADTKWLNSARVWEALLEKMPVGAMIRNLSKMARVGLLVPGSNAEKIVVERLSDSARIVHARVHPFRLLQAAFMYDSRFNPDVVTYNFRDQPQYEVSAKVSLALHQALQTSFSSVNPSGKRLLLALDVSSSMFFNPIPSARPLSAGEAAAVYALTIAKIEPNYQVWAFSDKFVQMPIAADADFNQVLGMIDGLKFGHTDIGLPITHAIRTGMEVDAFVVMTDNQVNFGAQPSLLIKEYRRKSGIDARFVSVAMVANQISVADPRDPGMLDVVGFNTEAFETISNFVAHKI